MAFINELKAGKWDMADLGGIAEWIGAVKASGSDGYKGADGYLYVWDGAKAVSKYVMVDGKPTLRFPPEPTVDTVALDMVKGVQADLWKLRKHLEG